MNIENTNHEAKNIDSGARPLISGMGERLAFEDAAGCVIEHRNGPKKPKWVRRLLDALAAPLAIVRGIARSLVANAMRIASGFLIGGVYTVQCFAADGTLRWTETAHNQVKNGGLDHMLGVTFKGSAQVTTWYVGLVTAGGTTTTAGDTLASHAGWTEATPYAGNRIAWDEGTASGGVITSTTTSDFTINATATIMGIFICSVNSGTSGTLWSTADFATSQLVNSGDVLKVTYTLTATSSS